MWIYRSGQWSFVAYREGADLDWDFVLDEAQKSGVAFEINANPSRLDIDEVHVRQAVEMGIPILSIRMRMPWNNLTGRLWGFCGTPGLVKPDQILSTWNQTAF
jgi:DNA polymerase (family 10)